MTDSVLHRYLARSLWNTLKPATLRSIMNHPASVLCRARKVEVLKRAAELQEQVPGAFETRVSPHVKMPEHFFKL